MKKFLQSLFGSSDPKPSTPGQEAYLKKYQPLPKSTPIYQVRFWVVDTETTGLDTKKDLPISIGAVPVQDYQILVDQSWESLIRQDHIPKSETVAIHGLLRRAVLDGDAPEAVGEEMLGQVGSSVMVAHHAAFDHQMAELLISPFQLKNPWLDTAHLAKRLELPPNQMLSPQESQRFSLDSLLERYNIRPTDRHTAAGDALLTAQLLVKLLKRLEDRGVKTLGDLLRH